MVAKSTNRAESGLVEKNHDRKSGGEKKKGTAAYVSPDADVKFNGLARCPFSMCKTNDLPVSQRAVVQTEIRDQYYDMNW